MLQSAVSFAYLSDLGDEPFRLSIRLPISLKGRFLVSAILVTDGTVIEVAGACPLKPGNEEVLISAGPRLRELPFATSVIVLCWRLDGPEAVARLSQDAASRSVGFLGRAVFPLFNDSGVLMQGKRFVFFEEKVDPACFPEEALFKSTLLATGWVPPRDWLLGSNRNVTDAALVQLLKGVNVENSALLENKKFLLIGLPYFGVPVLFSETRNSSTRSAAVRHRKKALSPERSGGVSVHWLVAGSPFPTSAVQVRPGILSKLSAWTSPAIVAECDQAHPAALKVARLARKSTVRLGSRPLNPARPTADELRRITDVVSQPFRNLSLEEKSLFLHFAWALTDRKAALVKFLQVIDWTDAAETTAAIGLMNEWSPPDIEDALALLGKDFATCPQAIREFAVKRLAVPSEELRLYLLQLVQGLQFDGTEGELVGEWPLAKFLVHRAVEDQALATQLFWYIQAEDEGERGAIFSKVAHHFWLVLGNDSAGQETRKKLEVQCAFRRRLAQIAADIKNRKSERAEKKSERLRLLLKEPMEDSETPHSRFGDPLETLDLTMELGKKITIPLDPKISLVRIDPAQSFCAKSALSPLVLACEVERTDESGSAIREIRRYMYKAGDDLRQDQLILQLITLMDTLFKRYGLDLKLTPYSVLATSKDDGFIEFVQDSQSLSALLASHGDNLLDFFRTVRPSPGGYCGIDPKVLDTFSRSCAGYCVITYVLGVGDRHLDNLLLTTDGRLFHVDFGYIFGRDPKPFPPPMKLCKEMVDGMGGANSPYYKNFVSKCCQAYSILRRHAKLLISLLSLASDADIKDMREQDPEMVILKVQQKLQPEATDAKAEQDFVSLINESTTALFPVVIEKLHKWALYWR